MANPAYPRWRDWRKCVGGNGENYIDANRAHWAKLRTNNVQERANREIKRRYRVVQSFPSRESMLRLTCASLMETEGQWSQQRVFSEASAAEGFAGPADRPAPTEGRRRALGRRAGEIVDEIVEKRGLKKE